MGGFFYWSTLFVENRKEIIRIPPTRLEERLVT